MHKFGRVASKTERLFRYDGPTIWGIRRVLAVMVCKRFQRISTSLLQQRRCDARDSEFARQLSQVPTNTEFCFSFTPCNHRIHAEIHSEVTSHAFNSDIEHLRQVSSEWSEFQKERYKPCAPTFTAVFFAYNRKSAATLCEISTSRRVAFCRRATRVRSCHATYIYKKR